MPTLELNFSRPGAQVLPPYYQFLRPGREGYPVVPQDSLDVAQYPSSEIEKHGPFDLVSRGDTIPVFAWRLKKGSEPENWDLYDLADRLRMRGWLVPAYPMPDDMSELVVQRIVVRVGLSRNLASFLLDAIREEVALLESLESPLPRAASAGTGFAH